MEKILFKMVEDYNETRELYALQCDKKYNDGENISEAAMHHTSGEFGALEPYIYEMAYALGYKVIKECGEHEFGYDDWKRNLVYVTITLERKEG